MRSRLTSLIVGLVQVEINMLRGWEYLIILTCKLGSKTIVLRCFTNCQLHGLCKTYNKITYAISAYYSSYIVIISVLE